MKSLRSTALLNSTEKVLGKSRLLKPGVSTFLIHTAYDNDELKAMTIDHPDWGAAWRQKDYDYFTSDACTKLLEGENIQLVTWRQLKEAYYAD